MSSIIAKISTFDGSDTLLFVKKNTNQYPLIGLGLHIGAGLLVAVTAKYTFDVIKLIQGNSTEVPGDLFSITTKTYNAFGPVSVVALGVIFNSWSLKRAASLYSAGLKHFGPEYEVVSSKISFNHEKLKSEAILFAKDNEDLLNYIKNILKDQSFIENPQGFMAKWQETRGTTEEFRFPEDCAREFLKKEILKMTVQDS